MQQLIRFAAFALAALVVVLLASPSHAQERAEGQSKADYLAWLSRDPGARAQVLSFKAFLQAGEVDDVVPTWQLVRTASKWRACGGPRFEVAPAAEWSNISATLKFIKAEVEPVIGDVQPVSGFRNAELNQCSGGAKASAHRHFYALDLVPVDEAGSTAPPAATSESASASTRACASTSIRRAIVAGAPTAAERPAPASPAITPDPAAGRLTT
jgi:hypothetical protein